MSGKARGKNKLPNNEKDEVQTRSKWLRSYVTLPSAQSPISTKEQLPKQAQKKAKLDEQSQ